MTRNASFRTLVTRKIAFRAYCHYNWSGVRIMNVSVLANLPVVTTNPAYSTNGSQKDLLKFLERFPTAPIAVIKAAHMA